MNYPVVVELIRRNKVIVDSEAAAGLETAVILAPTTTARNLTHPTVDAVAQTWKAFSNSQSSPVIRVLNADDAVVWSIGPSGDLQIGAGTTNATLVLNGAAGSVKQIALETAGVQRWNLSSFNDAESGSDAGSTFILKAYSDTGSGIDSPISIVRAAGGLMAISRPLTVAGDVDFAGDLTMSGATKNISFTHTDAHEIKTTAGNLTVTSTKSSGGLLTVKSTGGGAGSSKIQFTIDGVDVGHIQDGSTSTDGWYFSVDSQFHGQASFYGDIYTTLTAGLPVFSTFSGRLINNTVTGTGAVVRDVSPTITGPVGIGGAPGAYNLLVTGTLGVTGGFDLTGSMLTTASIQMILAVATGYGYRVDWNGIGTHGPIGVGYDGLVLSNTTAATVSQNQNSPRIRFAGRGWKTNATAQSRILDYIQELRAVTGAAEAEAQLVFSWLAGSGSYTDQLTLSSVSGMTLVGNAAISGTLNVTGVPTFTAAGVFNGGITSVASLASGFYEVGTFTGTLTGVTTTVTGTCNYVRVGKMVIIHIPEMLGTSNSTTCGITGVPASLRPTTDVLCAGSIRPINNSTTAVAECGGYMQSGGTFSLINNNSASGFTNSGTKGISGIIAQNHPTAISYMIT